MSNYETSEKDKKPQLACGPALASLPRKIYIDGKELIEQISDDEDRSTFVHKFILQLTSELSARDDELESLQGKSSAPEEFLDAAKLILAQADEVTNAMLGQKSVGAPPSLSDARSLLGFIETFDKLANQQVELPSEYQAWAEELCGDIYHFVHQIEMTYGIVNTDKNGMPKPPNRPTDLAGKKCYWELVEEHRASNGEGTFPKLKFAHEKLAAQGIKVTTKTIGNWRGQIQEGTFFHFVQSKKRK